MSSGEKKKKMGALGLPDLCTTLLATHGLQEIKALSPLTGAAEVKA